MDICIRFIIAGYPRDDVYVSIYPLNGGYLCRGPNSEVYFYLRNEHQENWKPIIREFFQVVTKEVRVTPSQLSDCELPEHRHPEKGSDE